MQKVKAKIKKPNDRNEIDKVPSIKDFVIKGGLGVALFGAILIFVRGVFKPECCLVIN